MPALVVMRAPGNALPNDHRFLLEGDQFVLGRDPELCNLHIPNQTVSKKHAQITRSNGVYIIEDLKSRNHTFINNREAAAPTVLKNDDRIKICDFIFRFVDERATASLKLPDDFAGRDSDENPREFQTTFDYEHAFNRGQAEQFLDAQPAERLRALLDISASLAKTLELEPLLPQISETLFNVFRQADRCFILIYDENGKLIPKVAKPRRPMGMDDLRYSRTIIRKCLESMSAYLTADASEDAALGAAQSIAEFRIRSVMCVPLANSEGKPLGAIQLDTQERTRKFKEDDLKLLTIVGNFASVAVEKASFHQAVLNQRKQEQEIEIARKVQVGFLPQVLPVVEGYEFYAAYSPAQSVGGDYYDFIPLPDGRMAIVLGDVAGKGVPASLLMAKLSAEARFCFLTQPDPAKAVCLLNEQLICGGIGDRFVTFAAVILDPKKHAVTLVNAGHLNPFFFEAKTSGFREAITNKQSGLPLGLMSGFPYEAIHFHFAAGDGLVLFTDGVTDAMSPNDQQFGYAGLKTALSGDSQAVSHRPKSMGERLMKAVRLHASGRPQTDDIAVACVGRVDETSSGSTGSSVTGAGTATSSALSIEVK
ncbi:MAG: SpoIIE family protein phosphatase [Gemmataceae bacterium]